MKKLIINKSIVHLIISTLLIIIGTALFILSHDYKLASKAMMLAGFIGYLYFGLVYFLIIKKTQ
jgi:hypothetical protein